MIIFLLIVIILELGFITGFFFYAVYEPFTVKKRQLFREELKKEIEYEKAVKNN